MIRSPKCSYNKTDHPVAFHKADMFSTSKKMVADKGPAPDIEDVVVSPTKDGSARANVD